MSVVKKSENLDYTPREVRFVDRFALFYVLILLGLVIFRYLVQPFVSFLTNVNYSPNVTEEMAEDVIQAVTENFRAEVSMKSKPVCDRMGVFFLDNDHNANTLGVCLEAGFHVGKKIPPNNASVTLLGVIVVFLLISAVFSIYDAASVIKNSLLRRSGDTYDGDQRKCSLVEFANARHSRKESSVTSSEPIVILSRSVAGRAASLCRYESVGSAFTRMRRDSVALGVGTPMPGPGLPTGNDTPSTPPIGPIRTHLKLIGGRPAPLLRRSSFPASALMLDAADRRGSIESEDDSSPDMGRRRVRIIRRH